MRTTLRMRSPKYDRRYRRSGTLNKKIIGGLLLFAVVIFLVSVREHVASGESVVIQERRLAVGEAADVEAGEPRTL
jgi:hypothetical protein